MPRRSFSPSKAASTKDSDSSATELEVVKRKRRRTSRGKQTSRGGKYDKRIREWQSVPEELIDLIVQRLPLFDRLSFSRVCKSWRTFYDNGILFNSNRGNRRTPWLTMSKGMYLSTCSRFCYSIMEDACYKLNKIPEYVGGKGAVWAVRGYLGDWLLVWDMQHYGVNIAAFLSNPFTGDMVKLPNFSFLGGFLKLQVSSTPSNRDESCVFMRLNRSCAYFWALGAPQWVKLVELPYVGGYLDGIFCQGRFYILGENFTRVTVFEAEHVLSIVRSGKETATVDEMKGMKYVMNQPAGMSLARSQNIACMVPSCSFEDVDDDDGGGGDMKILLVRLVNIPPSSSCHIYVYKLDVSSSDEDEACWVEVESLGDRVLFVSPLSSICYSRGELGKGMSNSIFFANPCTCRSNALIFYCNYSSSGCKVDGWRKANMYEECCECFPLKHCSPGRVGMTGMWLNAPTWW